MQILGYSTQGLNPSLGCETLSRIFWKGNDEQDNSYWYLYA